MTRTSAAHRFDRAQRFVHVLLEDAQQADLHRLGNVADLIEEDRAAFGVGESTHLVTARVGERSGDVAEELRLEQGVR